MSGLARTPLRPARGWPGTGRLVTDLAARHDSAVRWWIALGGAAALMGLFAVCVGWLLFEGVGIWGNNVPVTWALDIVGYDWWIGVACGSTTLSALLLLLGAAPRGAIDRLADTVAVIGAVAAGLYPIVHLGRPWFFYWNLPYPNTFLLWPQFRSPLTWDAVAILAFLPTSLSVWFTGLLPDLASMRDRAWEAALRLDGKPGGWLRMLKAQMYGLAALGWRGSAVHWQRWNHTRRALAVFALVVVVSLQTGAAVMFAGTVEPGWHDAILPLAHLCGALLAGTGVLAMLLAIVRWLLPLRPLITPRHFELLAAALLGLALASLYMQAAPLLTTELTGSGFEHAVSARRFSGPHAWAAWTMVVGALVVPHVLWLRAARRSAAVLLVVGALATLGVWADHFMLIVGTLQHDFLPSAAHPYAVDVVDAATFAGTVGLFAFLLLLALRYVPILSIAELRAPNEAARHG